MLENPQSSYSNSIAGSHTGLPTTTYLLTSSPVKQDFNLPSQDGHSLHSHSPFYAHKSWEYVDDNVADLQRLAPIRPNRRVGEDVEMGGIDRLSENNVYKLTENNVSKHNVYRPSNVNPAVHNFTSPIGMPSVLLVGFLL